MSTDIEKDLFGCESIEDIEIASNSSYFEPEAGNEQKVRFLKGPFRFYTSQVWEDGKIVGDTKTYAFDDPEAQKDPNSVLHLGYVIYDYKAKDFKIWDIKSKPLLKRIKAINEDYGNISICDFRHSGESKKMGNNEYIDSSLIPLPQKPFDDKDIIAKYKELDPYTKFVENMEKRIDETKNGSSIEQDEKAIQAEIAAKKAAEAEAKGETATVEDVKEAFQ